MVFFIFLIRETIWTCNEPDRITVRRSQLITKFLFCFSNIRQKLFEGWSWRKKRH